MKNAPYACLLLLALASAILAGDITINPGSEFRLSSVDATGGSAGDNGNVSFNMRSSFSPSAKKIKAEVDGGISLGTGWANSQIYYEFEVGSGKNTAGNTVMSLISYSVDWQGYQVILGSLGTNASVVVELVLRDMTDNQTLKVDTIHSLDLKTHKYKIITVGLDYDDSGTKIDTFAAVLKRGHTYRLTLRMSTTLFVIIQSGTPSICDYMDGFVGGGNGGVELNSLNVKVGLDEKEVSSRINLLEGQVTDLEDNLTSLENKVNRLENKVTRLQTTVTGLEDHRHIYLTGVDPSHNTRQAESSGPMPPIPVIITHKAAGEGETGTDKGNSSKPPSRLYKPLPRSRPDER